MDAYEALERRLDGNYTRMLRAVLNKSWRQHPRDSNYTDTCPPSQKLYKFDEPDTQGHCWRSKDELISDVLLWTPAHGCAGVGRPARTYIQQLCEDTGCNPEDLRGRWMIGRNGGRRSGISAQAARHDDDDDIYILSRKFPLLGNLDKYLYSNNFLQKWFRFLLKRKKEKEWSSCLT